MGLNVEDVIAKLDPAERRQVEEMAAAFIAEEMTPQPLKTAISIPDDVFEGAERTASALGLSRSELYATAVREFVERYRSADVTGRLDRIYGEDDSPSRLDERLQTLQTYSLGRDDRR